LSLDKGSLSRALVWICWGKGEPIQRPEPTSHRNAYSPKGMVWPSLLSMWHEPTIHGNSQSIKALGLGLYFGPRNQHLWKN